MRQYVAYGKLFKLITSANRRRSDVTPLDGRHGVSGRRSSSSYTGSSSSNTDILCHYINTYNTSIFCSP